MSPLPSTCSKLTAWYQTSYGMAVVFYGFKLLQYMLNPWPRRGQNLLVMGYGSGQMLSYMWEAGFDVTAVDPDLARIKAPHLTVDKRLNLDVAALDHLPYADGNFDFVIISPLLADRAAPQSVLEEAVRVASKGLLLAYWNPWSLAALTRLYPCSVLYSLRHIVLWHSSYTYKTLIRQIAPDARIWNRSTLLTPSALWTRPWAAPANAIISALPVGALGIVGVELAPGTPLTGTPLRLESFHLMQQPQATAVECHQTRATQTRQ